MRSILFTFFLFASMAHAQTVSLEVAQVQDELMMLPYDQKLKKLKKMIKKNPKDVWNYWMRAGVYDMMGENDLAVKDYQTALAIDSNFTAGHISLARHLRYSDSTQFQLALTHINKAIELDSTDWMCNIEKGYILLGLGEYQLAFEEGNRVLSQENVDLNAGVRLIVEAMYQSGEKKILKNYMMSHDLTQLHGFMDTKFDLLVGDLYKEYGEMEKACASYGFAAEHYAFMDEEVPADIQERLVGCE